MAFEKTLADYAGLQPYADMASDRVLAEEDLAPFYDLLIEYDWLEQKEHWEWVATADLDEIVAWCLDIRADEEDAAEDEEPEPFKYERAVRLTITLYPEQVRVVEALAHKEHRGKKSPAIQEMVDYWAWAWEGCDNASRK